MMRAEVHILVESNAEMISSILNSESNDEISRNCINVKNDADSIVITINAEDVVALRAALNSYLRWTKLAMDTNEAIGGIG
jgi:tRNA threonylcarbamoyladenosine modification (KEOPS) complex  Pcc1 subunit